MNDEWNVTMRDKNPTLKNVTKSLGALPETFKYEQKVLQDRRINLVYQS